MLGREGKEETNKWKHEQHMGSKWQHLRVLLVTADTLWHRKRSRVRTAVKQM